MGAAIHFVAPFKGILGTLKLCGLPKGPMNAVSVRGSNRDIDGGIPRKADTHWHIPVVKPVRVGTGSHLTRRPSGRQPVPCVRQKLRAYLRTMHL